MDLKLAVSAVKKNASIHRGMNFRLFSVRISFEIKSFTAILLPLSFAVLALTTDFIFIARKRHSKESGFSLTVSS